jgi:hypothetical protein
MRRLASATQGLVLAVLAAGGVVVAHTLDYWLVEPSTQERHDLLATTGHAHLPVAELVMSALAVTAGVLAVASGFRLGIRDGTGPRRTFRREVALVTALQSTAFVGLELAERMAAGSSGRAFGVLLSFGLALQPLVASIAVLLAHLLSKLGKHLAEFVVAGRRPAACPRRVRVLRPTSWESPARSACLAPLPPRGPPSSLLLEIGAAQAEPPSGRERRGAGNTGGTTPRCQTAALGQPAKRKNDKERRCERFVAPQGRAEQGGW